MALKLSVDRIENGIAVCYDDDCKKHEIPADGLFEGAVISVLLDSDGNFVSASVLESETEERRGKLASRTRALFNRKKK